MKSLKQYQNLSSTNLFNFTDSIDYLKDNLKNGFYCEDILERLPNFGTPSAYYLPMVSFCDIPLGVIKEHLGWYGNYAIGIKRQFARQNSVTPIWYVHKQNQACKLMHANGSLSTSPILPYLKLFIGNQIDPIGVVRKKKFYDEKEWRFIPPGDDFKPQYLKDSSYGKIEATFNGIGGAKRKARMPIDINTVEYIIVPDEADKIGMYTFLQGLANNNHQFLKLVSSLITCKQIRNDF